MLNEHFVSTKMKLRTEKLLFLLGRKLVPRFFLKKKKCRNSVYGSELFQTTYRIRGVTGIQV